jgi:Site-specific DNA methylase
MKSKVIQSRMNFYEGLVIDNFAGGGGASTGIELALCRPVDLAINHDQDAIAMHQVNHPFTEHFCESVWDINPKKATNGQPVMLAWFSPDCTHFSKARGCKPAEKNIRGLAWVAARWAATVKPKIIILENVEEFKTWGPLGNDGRPIKEKAGITFERFVNTLRDLGYVVDWTELKACDYGAPTTRKRFFLVARCDGLPVVWPEVTHGSGKIPFRTAAEIIDWSFPCPSIFDTADEIKQKYGVRAVRPLASATQKRIAKGLKKFVIENPNPFIVSGENMVVAPHVISIGQTGFSVDRSRPADVPLNTIVSKAEQCLVTSNLIQYHGETSENGVRGQSIDQPIMTTDTSNRYALVAAHIVKFKHNDIGQAAQEPLHTICSSTVHFAEVRTFLTQYFGENDHSGIISLNGIQYSVADIGMRMLTPRELFNAQGFPADYVIDVGVDGKPVSKQVQIARCGNSVCPALAESLVRANLPEQCGRKIETMYQLEKELEA